MGQLAIVIVMALVLAFLVSVAPVSGAKLKTCKDYCDKKEIVWDEEDVLQEKCVPICYIRSADEIKWKYSWRWCDFGHYEQWCYDQVYCPNSGCMKIDGSDYNKLIKKPGFVSKCTKWYYTFVRLPPGNSPCDS